MATRKLQLDEARVQSCLVVIRQLYIDYSTDEIVEAFAQNRREIAAREEQARLENELLQAQERLNALPKPIDTNSESC